MTPLDLNLLLVFEALYDLRSATKAARRLNVTQSAVSHALRRLRAAIGDPLFVKAGGTLQPTARADELARGVGDGLARLRLALDRSTFDPTTSARSFTIAAGPYFCTLIVPALAQALRRNASRIGLRVVPAGETLLTDLDTGLVDIALGAFDKAPPWIKLDPLFEEELVWVSSRRRPAPTTRELRGQGAGTPKAIIATRRPFEPAGALLGNGARAAGINNVGDLLESDGSIIAYDARTAALLVSTTDLIALVPRRTALAEQEALDLRLTQAGPGFPAIQLSMATHDRRADGAIGWLKDLVLSVSVG